MPKPKANNRLSNKQSRLVESQEIELLERWIEFGKPDSASNPLSLPPLPDKSPIGLIDGGLFSRYAGCDRFSQLPLSKKTKDGLKDAKFIEMTDIQRAALPHSLCGRDILGAAKTGSGKTLAFLIPVLEKLYKEKWGREDGVGALIISPTRELGNQIFDVLKAIGKYHGFSAGLLIGGRKGVETEKECVNELNILICTPGRLLQHMDQTPNFDCSQLQVLVLDEADRILDVGFKKELNAIVAQLPKRRQTLLFSATQTKSVQDLARLSLKDPEYLSVHEEATTATPTRLHQTAMIVPLDQKFDMLWSFVKAHLNSKILVFLTSRKQVKYVFETFKKLRPGIPLRCLHGKMNQEKRLGMYSQFSGRCSVLFSTDVSARGLDFDKAVDWVVQMDCPSDVATYIHRVGRTARYDSVGKSILFIEPSEMKMLEKLKDAKIPIRFTKPNKSRLEPVSPLLAALIVKYPSLQQLAQRAFITYLKAICKEKDKEVFDVMKLPIDSFSASLGLPHTPKIRLLNKRFGGENASKNQMTNAELNDTIPEHLRHTSTKLGNKLKNVAESDKDLLAGDDNSDNDLLADNAESDEDRPAVDDSITKLKQGKTEIDTIMPATRILKKKKLKINIHRPIGERVVFDDDGVALPPLATMADTKSGNGTLDVDKVKSWQDKVREKLKQEDVVDKKLSRELRREKRLEKKLKIKRAREEGDEEDEELSGSNEEDQSQGRVNKKTKFNLDSDDEIDVGDVDDKMKHDLNVDAMSLGEQEALAMKVLSQMHS